MLGEQKWRCVFGQHAAQYQLIGIALIVAAIVLLFVSSSAVIHYASVAAICVGLVVYVVHGHALIYGPHLFLLLIIDLFRSRRF
jgi:hypothetical protein